MIRIDIDDRKVKQALQTLQRRLGDMTPAAPASAEIMIRDADVHHKLREIARQLRKGKR